MPVQLFVCHKKLLSKLHFCIFLNMRLISEKFILHIRKRCKQGEPCILAGREDTRDWEEQRQKQTKMIGADRAE